MELVDTDSRRALPLARLSVAVNVQCFIAEVKSLRSLCNHQTTVLMTFSNDSDRVLEGELVFPLPEGGFVSGYGLDVEGQIVPGGVICARELLLILVLVIVSKTQSRVAFETTGGSNSCGMIEQTVGNVYKTRIYPLPAR